MNFIACISILITSLNFRVSMLEFMSIAQTIEIFILFGYLSRT